MSQYFTIIVAWTGIWLLAVCACGRDESGNGGLDIEWPCDDSQIAEIRLEAFSGKGLYYAPHSRTVGIELDACPYQLEITDLDALDSVISSWYCNRDVSYVELSMFDPVECGDRAPEFWHRYAQGALYESIPLEVLEFTLSKDRSIPVGLAARIGPFTMEHRSSNRDLDFANRLPACKIKVLPFEFRITEFEHADCGD